MWTEQGLRQHVQQEIRNNPNLQKLESHQAPDYWTQQVWNNEVENQRRADEQRRRNGG